MDEMVEEKTMKTVWMIAFVAWWVCFVAWTVCISVRSLRENGAFWIPCILMQVCVAVMWLSKLWR